MGIQDRDYYTNDAPRGLAPSWSNRSVISWLIIINVALYVIDILVSPRRHDFTEFLVLHASDANQPWMLWRTLSYGFAHSPFNIFHLFWNMLGLWMLGRAVEEHYGRWEFLRIYLLAIVLGGAGWLLRHAWNGDGGLLGASGAVCCIEMLFILNFPRVILMIWGVIPTPAWLVGVFLVAGNLIQDSRNNIAIDVHLIGIAFAAVYFYLGLHFGIEHWRIRWKNLWRPRLKVHDPISDSRDEEEMDRLLKKMHDQGQDSLTSSERKFMERYSRKLRQRRQES